MYHGFWNKEDYIDREIREIIEKTKEVKLINEKDIFKSCGGF